MRVFVAALMERSVADHAVLALMAIARACGERGYTLLGLPYGREDVSRNWYVRMFLGETSSPNDALIMLDCDHSHPEDIVTRLVAWSVDVVGALAFKRSAPHEPCFFMKDEDGKLIPPAAYPYGLVKCDAVGSGAVCIRRRVFDKLDKAGYPYPYFRWTYQDRVDGFPSDDIYLADICAKAGVQEYCDTTLITPHLALTGIDDKPFKAYIKQHADKLDLVKA